MLRRPWCRSIQIGTRHRRASRRGLSKEARLRRREPRLVPKYPLASPQLPILRPGATVRATWGQAAMRTDADHARELDRRDPLAGFRERFAIHGPEIYLDGNSLGRLPKAALPLAADLVGRQWGRRLIRGWNDGWIGLPERVGAKIARLIGAGEDEVLVADST